MYGGPISLYVHGGGDFDFGDGDDELLFECHSLYSFCVCFCDVYLAHGISRFSAAPFAEICI